MATPLTNRTSSALRAIKLPLFSIFQLQKQGKDLKNEDIILLRKTSFVPSEQLVGKNVERIDYYLCLKVSKVKRVGNMITVTGTESMCLSVHGIKFQYETHDFVNTYKETANTKREMTLRSNGTALCLLFEKNLMAFLKSSNAVIDDSEFCPFS